MKKYLYLVLPFLLLGCDMVSTARLTQTNLDKIHQNMSPQDVKAILGDPKSSKTEAIPLVGGNQTTYVYDSDTSEVTIIFKNDLVQEKVGSFN